LRRVQFLVPQDGVERHQHAGGITVGMGRQLFDVVHPIARRRPRAKRRPADIHRIGAVADGLDAKRQVPGGSEEFEAVTGRRHGQKTG
jgi:hypothetical protein